MESPETLAGTKIPGIPLHVPGESIVLQVEATSQWVHFRVGHRYVVFVEKPMPLVMHRIKDLRIDPCSLYLREIKKNSALLEIMHDEESPPVRRGRFTLGLHDGFHLHGAQNVVIAIFNRVA